jgi:hypothetical protein
MVEENKGGQQMRFSNEELSLIKSTFKNNTDLLKLMRKVFLPEIDPKAPLGQMIDLWMTVPVKEMTAEQAQVNILARNSLIMHIEQMLLQLHALAEMDGMTISDVTKNSAK